MSNPETWARRDLPVLRVIASDYDDSPLAGPRPVIDVSSIADRTELSVPDVERAIRSIIESGLIAGSEPIDQTGYPSFVIGIPESTRRIVGQWPDSENVGRLIISALESMESRAEVPSEKSSIRSILDGIPSFGAKVLGEVAVKVVTGGI